MNDLVIMERQNIVDIADAIRNKTGANDEMTLVDMVTTINEIDTSGPELPSAEQDGVFGLATQNEEYGIVINDTGKLNYYAYPGDFDIVVRYRAKEAFSLLGARAYLRSNNYSTKFTISINGELKATFNIPYQQGVKVWTNRYFDQQYNIAVGDVIEIRQTGVSYPTYIPLSATTINGKVEVTYSKGGSGGENPTLVHGVYDIIMAPVQAELPDKYQIERATMDDMAVEVQRITNIDTKINIEQMQSSLESIVLQEKTITPTTEQQIIAPDSNYYGLSKVTVNPAQLQEKIVTPTTEEQIIVPDSDYYGLSKVTVEAAAVAEELPSAEDGAFGLAQASAEYGIISPEALGEQNAAVSGVTGMEFKARESIAIAGLRVKPARASNTSLKLCLWNENAELLQQTSVIATTRNWLCAYFDVPVNINADEIFVASVQSQSNYPYRKKSGVTFNGKLSFQAGRTGASGAGYAGFPDSRDTSNIYGIVDVIIVPVQEELPNTYKVERTTMDDIAEEVQRITGIETKLSTAQIISNLSELEIENLEDYEEVAF